MKPVLEEQLEKYFGFKSFRTGQKEIIKNVTAGNDVLGILPTGSGKSLCYQLPARILTGTVVVVSPLISLMMDQEKQLKAAGFKDVIAVNSFLSLANKQTALQRLNQYKLIYVSPEMLQNKRFMEKLSELTIALFVIDEAHCISQWGHEFRPDYLKLKEVLSRLGSPPVLALSATATPEVQEDIIIQLGRPNIKKHVYPMDRENIAFNVKTFDHPLDKLDYLTGLLTRYHVPAMIYFSSRNWTEKAAMELSSRLKGRKVAFYHGGMDQNDRILIQQQFMSDQLDVICCTSAFGMGIDKQNIRLVIHFHLPPQMESFIQELGRAGRDGKSSVSLVLVSPNDEMLPKKLIESELPSEQEINQTFQAVQALYQQGRKLVMKDEEAAELFQLSETQWRFLRYQLEKHGIIRDNHIIFEAVTVKTAWKAIQHLVVERKRYKQEKLTEMLEWITKTGCRRVSLFAPFQNSIKSPIADCCDYCGFSFHDWSPEMKEEKNELQNWKEQFKNLMLQGN